MERVGYGLQNPTTLGKVAKTKGAQEVSLKPNLAIHHQGNQDLGAMEGKIGDSSTNFY